MIRKTLAMPLLCIGMAFFVQCSDNLSDYSADDQVLKAGKVPGGGGGKGGGGGEETAINNLSFPVFALDGFAINEVSEKLIIPYTGPYTGLTDAELAIAQSDTWYAQKLTENSWQAEYNNVNQAVNVTFIDWADVIESQNPKVGRPLRIEVTLYVDISDDPMDAYTMTILANPSSPDEIQGTNGDIYEGNWATAISSSPDLIIQKLGTGDIIWNQTLNQWTGDVGVPLNFSFGPELNVGGKYIYGGSSGGWKPKEQGKYRLTFYIPDNPDNKINLLGAAIGNYDGNTDGTWGTPTTQVAFPKVSTEYNLTYTDINVVTR